MIRLMNIEEIDAVMKIWLDANIDAHKEVDPQYWKDNYDEVKEAMENSNIYVSLKDDVIQGFVGVVEGYYMAGLFVAKESRGQGVGKILIDYIKERYDELTLNVYEHNEGAVRFYKREGFAIVESDIEPDTQLNEHTMVWPEKI